MSTRASAYYANSLHLFRELSYGEICLDVGFDDLDIPDENRNKNYGSFTMSLDNWVDFHRALGEAIDEMKEQVPEACGVEVGE